MANTWAVAERAELSPGAHCTQVPAPAAHKPDGQHSGSAQDDGELQSKTLSQKGDRGLGLQLSEQSAGLLCREPWLPSLASRKPDIWGGNSWASGRGLGEDHFF